MKKNGNHCWGRRKVHRKRDKKVGVDQRRGAIQSFCDSEVSMRLERNAQ